ncbi:MAG: hypothetical protein ABR903_06520, partial [Thermodesulfovibrionales bacterium]
MKKSHQAAPWKITAKGSLLGGKAKLYDAVHWGIPKQFALIALEVIFVLIVTCPTYAETSSDQPQTRNREQTQDQQVQTLGVVEVTDTTENLVGTADSANEGTAPREEVQSRPYYRVG